MKPLQIIAFMLCGLLLATTAHAVTRNLVVKSADAQQQKRVALVIGNSAYQGIPALKNPVNDATAMAEALNKLGFEVIEVTNASQREMNLAIASFGQKLTSDTAALFFYAGHGLQVKGKNYLVPVDAQIETEAEVRAVTVDVDAVLDQLAASTVSIVILDACRNNPFEHAFRKMGGGLAQMDAPKGSFIAYATAPGKTAADGTGNHGLFTQELLKEINTPGLELGMLMRRVRSNVAKETGDIQMPWDSSSMTGEFYFKPTQVASLEPVAVSAPVHVKTKDEIEQETWVSARDNNDIDSVNEYLKQYPKGKYVGLANILYKKLKKEAAHSAGQQTATQAASIDPVMVPIPGKNFEIGKYLVTRGEFAKFVKETGYDTGNDCIVFDGTKWTHGGNWHSPGFSQEDSHPVTCVNWNDAQAYVSWLSKKTGRNYKLPTESEWVVACYAGSQTEYCGGNDIESVAWHDDNSGKTTHPVGQKQANGYGLYDMSGNVWEWMENWYDNGQQYRALRGGAWNNAPQYVRASSPGNFKPVMRNSYGGFRLARTLSTETSQGVTQQTELPHGYVSQGGLTWMPESFTKNWAEANAYCNNTAINGQTGWRLPTKDELSALYNSGAMNGQGWTLSSAWSSTLYTPEAGYHYFVSLSDGFFNAQVDTVNFHMTCVR
jgi:formylglycine-generating enzyme required for sulfatase activity